MGVLKLTAISLSIALFMQSSLAFCFHKIAINSIGLKSPVSAMSPSFKLHSGSGVGNFKSSRHTCKMVSSLEDTSSAKSELLSIVSGTNMGTSESAESAQRIDLLVDKLSSQPSQFNRAVVDGEWALVFTRNSKGSPVLQRATQSVERLGGSFANFDVSRGEFYNIAGVLGGSGTLSATVKFSESSENPGRRITCDIVDAGLQLWGLPKLPLPLRASGGWLDFLYLDSEMRVTRGNRGGVFVHVRPAVLRRLQAAGAAE